MKFANSSLKPSKKYYILPAIDNEYAVAEYLFSVLPIIINLPTCPVIILLSAFIITAVRMKGRLRTMHNILLACMTGTDLADVPKIWWIAFGVLRVAENNSDCNAPSLPCITFSFGAYWSRTLRGDETLFCLLLNSV